MLVVTLLQGWSPGSYRLGHETCTRASRFQELQYFTTTYNCATLSHRHWDAEWLWTKVYGDAYIKTADKDRPCHFMAFGSHVNILNICHIQMSFTFLTELREEAKLYNRANDRFQYPETRLQCLQCLPRAFITLDCETHSVRTCLKRREQWNPSVLDLSLFLSHDCSFSLNINDSRISTSIFFKSMQPFC